MIEITLPYPVSANVYWTSFVLGKRIMTVQSAAAKKYKKECAKIIQAAGIREPILGRVHIDLELYPHRPADWLKRAQANPLNWDDEVRCIDIDNARKCLYDSLKNILLEDDKWVWSDTAKRMEPDGGEARVVVRIREIKQVAFAELQLEFHEPPAPTLDQMAGKPF